MTESNNAATQDRSLLALWTRITPSLVPLLAILTAMLVGSLFMIVAGIDWAALGEAVRTGSFSGIWGQIAPGFRTAGLAYQAMLEGGLGIAIGGDSLVHFVPANLVSTLVRSIPFLLAGLAVALGFKCGLFNIGAEGQLYAGALVAAFIGYAGFLDFLPGFLRIPLAMLGGILGGAFWGAIPGFLKARTGAHEVINTIMMNYIAIRLTDYLIKSRDPVIMLDVTAAAPRTPNINASAELPTLFGSNLHIGLFVALAAAVFVWWFLYKTTLGFEIRTVGANPDAARYSGMSISRSFVVAMGVSGALAGLAGAGEVLGVQHNMQPGFFGGVGFDSIAVALLAKNNPFGMIPAALLWGALLSGAALMQVRADITIDLVKIIQAFMIMFIAADQIVRYLWRIKAEPGETLVSLRGWGG